MPGSFHRKSHSSRALFIDRKISSEDSSLKTMKETFHTLRWAFLLITLFIISGISFLFITSGYTYMPVILWYSFIGFSTFFMGYLGWVLAQGLISMIKGNELGRERASSYYFSKRNKRRK